MNYGKLELNIDRILKERGISKNQICKDLDIPRSNFNRYCNNNFCRLDTGLLCKLCYYLNLEIGDLITYRRPEQSIPQDILAFIYLYLISIKKGSHLCNPHLLNKILDFFRVRPLVKEIFDILHAITCQNQWF